MLRHHDDAFQVFEQRGKGSHPMIFHPTRGPNGTKASFPLPYHKGRQIGQGLLRSLIRRFSLPPDIFG